MRVTELDCTADPVFVIRVRGRPTDREFADLLDAMASRFFARPRPYAVVYGGAGAITARQRRSQIRWLTTHDRAIRAWGRGVAFAFDAPLLRGAMRLILWAAPPAYSVTVVGSIDDGLTWAHARLRDPSAATRGAAR